MMFGLSETYRSDFEIASPSAQTRGSRSRKQCRRKMVKILRQTMPTLADRPEPPATKLCRAAELKPAGGANRPRISRRGRVHAPSRLGLGFQALDDFEQRLNGCDGFVEHLPFAAVESDLDDPLDAAGADHRRYADIEILDAVLAGQPGGARQYALLVAQKGLSHLDGGRRRRIEGRRSRRRRRASAARSCRAAPGSSTPS